MQYHPKLKKAMEEIKEVLKRHDIAGNVILHTPGFVEFLNHITPSYSCAFYKYNAEGTEVRIRAKKEDFGGDSAARNKKVSDTYNMLSCLEMETGRSYLVYHQLVDLMKTVVSEIEGTGGPGPISSHQSQNS